MVNKWWKKMQGLDLALFDQFWLGLISPKDSILTRSGLPIKFQSLGQDVTLQGLGLDSDLMWVVSPPITISGDPWTSVWEPLLKCA